MLEEAGSGKRQGQARSKGGMVKVMVGKYELSGKVLQSLRISSSHLACINFQFTRT